MAAGAGGTKQVCPPSRTNEAQGGAGGSQSVPAHHAILQRWEPESHAALGFLQQWFPVTATNQFWDYRYRERPAPTQPAKILVEFADCLPVTGCAIDLACGGGRNCVFLARRGLHSVGVDRSRAALEQGRELARSKGMAVDWVQADLENFCLPPLSFDVVLCTDYRNPKLYPLIREALKPNGLLIYQTFSREQLRFGTGPGNPEHLLGPGELFLAFEEWKILLYRERWAGRGIATLIARKPGARNRGSAIINPADSK
jgi:tellurite methyltransferase